MISLLSISVVVSILLAFSLSQGSTSCSVTQVNYLGTCIKNEPEFWNTATVVTSNNFTFLYGFDSTNTYIYFKFSGTHNGWVAFGFGSKMANADIIQCYVENNVSFVKDLKSSGYGYPNVDSSQNVVQCSGGRSAQGVWDIVVVRALNTGDTSQDIVVQVNTNIDIVYSFGPELYSVKHLSRGTKQVTLSTTSLESTTVSSIIICAQSLAILFMALLI